MEPDGDPFEALYARGVTDGILCYLRNEDVPDFQPVTP